MILNRLPQLKRELSCTRYPHGPLACSLTHQDARLSTPSTRAEPAPCDAWDTFVAKISSCADAAQSDSIGCESIYYWVDAEREQEHRE